MWIIIIITILRRDNSVSGTDLVFWLTIYLIESSLTEPFQTLRFLTAHVLHSSNCLLALSIIICGLCLDTASNAGLCLGLSMCVPHNCDCETLVELQAMVCKKAPVKIKCTTQLRLWDLSGASSHGVQESTSQNQKASCSQWRHFASLRRCWNLGCQGAFWTRQAKWKLSDGLTVIP